MLFLFILLLPSLVKAETIVFTCNIDKHLINIYKNADNKKFTYRSWNKPKPISTKPDMELTSFSYQSVVGSNYFKFRIGSTEFEVTDQWSHLGEEETPPEDAKNALGDLYIRVNGKLKSHYYCNK